MLINKQPTPKDEVQINIWNTQVNNEALEIENLKGFNVNFNQDINEFEQ